MRQILTLVTSSALVLALAACGGDDEDSTGPSANPAATATTPPPASNGADAERPLLVVTTNILGDVVASVVGDLATVEVIMPLGSDPHDFSPTVKQAALMEDADLLIVNGLGFEEGMLDLIEQVADGGTPTFAFAEAVSPLEGGHDHDHEGEETHDDAAEETHDHAAEETHDDAAEETHDHAAEETHDDAAEETHDHAAEETHDDAAEEGNDHGHDHEGELPDVEGPPLDPHFWTDPARMAVAVASLVDTVVLVADVDDAALREQAAAYIAELESIDADIESELAAVPESQRVLVTNHEVFAYFADRYGFEVVGAVVPSLTTSAETSTRELEELAALISAKGIPAIFAETTQSTELAEALAAEVGDEVQIVELFTESLGEPGSGAETYIDLMRTNADLVTEALGAA